MLAAGGALLLAAGCASTHDKGPYLPQTPQPVGYETREPVVLLDPGVQYSVTCSGIQEQILSDGRLEVVAHQPHACSIAVPSAGTLAEVRSRCARRRPRGFPTA